MYCGPVVEGLPFHSSRQIQPSDWLDLSCVSSVDSIQFFQISKSNVVDDMVESNSILYRPGEMPDHTVRSVE